VVQKPSAPFFSNGFGESPTVLSSFLSGLTFHPAFLPNPSGAEPSINQSITYSGWSSLGESGRVSELGRIILNYFRGYKFQRSKMPSPDRHWNPFNDFSQFSIDTLPQIEYTTIKFKAFR
jgi:hypothetical protein